MAHADHKLADQIHARICADRPHLTLIQRAVWRDTIDDVLDAVVAERTDSPPQSAIDRASEVIGQVLVEQDYGELYPDPFVEALVDAELLRDPGKANGDG